MGALIFEDKKVIFEGIVNEGEVPRLREFLNSNAPEVIEFDFEKCRDVHTAILQVVLAYKYLYQAIYLFPQDNFAYKTTLNGFFLSDNNTN